MVPTGRFDARGCIVIAILFGVATNSAETARADDVFAGKTIRIIVPAGPTGGYSLYGQLAANHLGRFISGKPAVVVSYMPGASGVTAMNFLYEAARRDGTAIAVLTQDLASQQALSRKGVRFDAAKFNYIGRAAANVPVHMVWHSAPAASIADIKRHEIVTGAVGNGGTTIDLPRAQNALIGTRWKIISGYRNEDSLIAIERGEVQAAISPATLFRGRLKPWHEQRKVNVIVQYADFRHPLFAQVPAITDLAEAPEAKAVFKFLVSLATVGRAFAAPPDVPAERVSILRNAFDAMVNDPAFRADAERRGADLMPRSGKALAAYVREIVATPPAIVRKTKQVIAAK
ncbi:MAG: Bug family tripartite tricarboxylate transporter substrate binding protein [Xanthobacteraceae bacterium]